MAQRSSFPQPALGLPGHKARHRAAPTALIYQAVDLLAEVGRPAPPSELARHSELPTQGETRVPRYLPSNLPAREIADELYLSMNTVKTHQRHLYRRLGARTRPQAVERARALGLLAPSSTTRAARATAGAGCPPPRGGSQERMTPRPPRPGRPPPPPVKEPKMTPTTVPADPAPARDARDPPGAAA